MTSIHTASFSGHMAALRRHLLWGFVVFGLAATMSLVFVDALTGLVLRPVADRELLFLTALGPLFFKLKVALLIAALVVVPFWIGLLLHFIAPALSYRQLRPVAMLVGLSLLLLGGAVTVTFLFVVPASLLALDAVSVPGIATHLTAESYLDLAILETLVIVAVVQIPIAIHLLMLTHIVDPAALARKRGVLYVGLCVVLAVLTPTTDMLSLLAVFGVAVVFLELGLLSARLIHSRRQVPRNRRVQ